MFSLELLLLLTSFFDMLMSCRVDQKRVKDDAIKSVAAFAVMQVRPITVVKNTQIVLFFQCRSSFDASRRAETTKDLLRRNRSVRHDGRASPTKNVALRMSIIHVVTFVTCWTPYLVSALF